MARKSNKTSHVLHLLAGEEPAPEPETEKEEKTGSEPEASGAAQKTVSGPEPEQPESPEISIITTGSAGDDPLSDLIKGELEEVFGPGETDGPEEISPTPEGTNESEEISAPLEETNESEEISAPLEETDGPEETPPTPEGTNGSEEISAPLEETDGPEETPPTPETTDNTDISADDQKDIIPDPGSLEKENPDIPGEASPEAEEEASHGAVQETDSPEEGTAGHMDPDPPVQEAVESPEQLNALLHPEEGDNAPHYRFINVMEYIVKDMVIDYMKKFSMCTCERCVVDTIALALTFCSSKYIVVDKNTVSPLLNYYSNKFTGDVTVALTRACTLVNENPRH